MERSKNTGNPRGKNCIRTNGRSHYKIHQGTQKMKPLVTPEEKLATVKTFAASFGTKLHARNYDSVQKALNDGLITPLYDLPRKDTLGYTDTSGNTTYTATGKYAPYEALEYVRWLVGVVTGSIPTSEDNIEKAFDQLYTAIIALKNADQFLGQNFDILPAYSYFTSLTEVQAKVDKMDSQIVDALEKIIDWQQFYKPCLDEAKKRYDEEKEAVKRATRKQR
jgi:hypothetical protein